MSLTTEVINDCLDKNITSVRKMAAEYCIRDPKQSAEGARYLIRQVLGSAGAQVSPKHQSLYDRYKSLKGGTRHYETASVKKLQKSTTYIITSALNGTPVNPLVWKNILAYTEFRDASLHVVALRYHNPTSVFTDSNEEVWCSEVLPYLDAARHELFPGIHLMADIKIQPTAVTPLTGMNGFTGPESCIFGHPRVHMQFMPVPMGANPKIMMTTGCCTVPNYTDSKAGKTGEFHHTYGFVIANARGFHYVKINNDGSFIDYSHQVKNGVVSVAPRPKALVLGDIHAWQLDDVSHKRITNRILGSNPECVVLHDVMDGRSVNPHMEKNAVLKVKRYESGYSSLEDELNYTLGFLKHIKELCENVIVVASNHDDMLDRWIANMDWRKDIQNATKYAELLPIALREEGVFRYLASQIGVRATKVNESVLICGIEVNLHGDRGANGSRGSAVQFKNLSSKTIIGHGHGPFCLDGCVGVGVQTLDHEYNLGLSSWGVADALINADGKVQHIL